MPEEQEEYTIGMVNGFVVGGKDYHSIVFPTIEEAQAHLKKITESPKQERNPTRSYKKRK